MVLIITKIKNKEWSRTYTIQCKTEAECQKILQTEKDDIYDDFFYEIILHKKYKK